MRDDGSIDYSKYTLIELEEALAGINAQLYPRNHANLRAARERMAAQCAEPSQPGPVAPAPVTTTPTPGLLRRWWESRPVTALAGGFCFWWAHDLLTTSDACPQGAKLFTSIIRAVCSNFGHEWAAAGPFLLGVFLIVIAALPRRATGDG